MHFMDVLSHYIQYIGFREIMFYFELMINLRMTRKKGTRLHNKATIGLYYQCGGNLYFYST